MNPHHDTTALGLMRSACSTATDRCASKDDPLLAAGEQPPAGGPRSFTARQQGGCVEHTEWWRRGNRQVKGQVAWLKPVERQVVACP